MRDVNEETSNRHISTYFHSHDGAGNFVLSTSSFISLIAAFFQRKTGKFIDTIHAATKKEKQMNVLIPNTAVEQATSKFGISSCLYWSVDSPFPSLRWGLQYEHLSLKALHCFLSWLSTSGKRQEKVVNAKWVWKVGWVTLWLWLRFGLDPEPKLESLPVKGQWTQGTTHGEQLT